MSHWDAGTSDDENACVWCQARLDEWKYGPGARVCLTCAVTGGPDQVEQPKRWCGCGAELTGMGVVCQACEQKNATAWVADVDWAQPGYPTAQDKAEYEAWLDTMDRRLDEDRISISVEVPEGVGPGREQGPGDD